MKEAFLHYLWQYQLFNKKRLTTTTGEPVKIFKAGQYNEKSGPDFFNAKLQIGEQLWAGTVEIHLKSSDWYVHNHETDMAYDNVILHVVWEEDMSVFRENNTPVSTLELKGLVPKAIWNNYERLFQKENRWIACEHAISQTDSFVWEHWLERLYIERLEEKSLFIEQLLKQLVNDWEAVLFQLLTKNFGLKRNGSAFAAMAKSLDFSVIRKERVNPKGLEALFMGQAGLLNEPLDDSYYRKLQELFQYQRHKYRLSSPVSKVQFFRLRPPNFPTIRLAQLANLFASHANLFQKLMRSNDSVSYYKLLQSQAETYWDTHYVFGKESRRYKKKTTESFIDLLLINTILPLRFAYQKYLGKQEPESLFQIIRQIKPEKNSTIQKYANLGLDVKNAMDTQALLQLYNSYCKVQRCLECTVGLAILKS